MTKSINSRELVLKMLIDIFENKKQSTAIINGTLDKYVYLEKKERSFIKRLAEGTIEKVIELDYIIDLFSKIKVKKMKAEVRNLLRMAVYQIMYMDTVPDSAICNESVKLIQKSKYRDLKSFVNGVLRNICREKENVKYPDESNFSLYNSVKYSMPQWLIDKWCEDYDKDTVISILEGSVKKKSTTIRVNTIKTTKENLIKALENEGVTVSENVHVEEALEIEGYDTLMNLKSFNDGLFYVQDLSSMYVGIISGAKMGDYCIDVCAAPGGKTTHLAQLVGESGRVDARDVSLKKVEMIEENVERLGLRNVSAKVLDALVLDEGSIKKADIVIADLPCSGFGVLSKKSDIKYRVTKEDIDSLSKLQRDILSVVWNYVKPGGILMYCTCTITKEENEENLNWILNNYPFESVTIDEDIEGILDVGTKEKGYSQFIPKKDSTDGFFIAKLRRKA